MKKASRILSMAVVVLSMVAAVGIVNAASAKKASEPAKKQASVDAKKCYACHSDIKEFHTRGKHAKVNCVSCHDGLNAHLADSSKKPDTRMDHATCGGCHKEQYESFVSMNYDSKAKVEKATYKSRSPLFDKLIAPHGFSKEHDEPRSHVFMLLDHYIVDRGYGGRFQLNNWTSITNATAAEKNLWSVITDKEPATADQKSFIPQSATAANPVCLQCKSQDNILKWKYMGDKDPKAQWSRESKVVELARDLKHPVNCFACHDPHSAEPRVVRDALIDAVVDRKLGTYPYDKEKSEKIMMTKVTFRDGFRAIGLLNKPDSNVMCAQCHVEYNCNPGTDPKTGAKIGMNDRRTNYFPWSNVLDLKKKYEEVSFKDFKHATTGALLTKIQHPEVETFWGSKHERAGVECKDCHMPKVKGKGKDYTWHGQRSARNMEKVTCIKCHSKWDAKEADYQIDAIQNYVRGKITKAEFWLGQLIDKYYEAKMAGVGDDILKQAREKHDEAHILWEWWTAENSDGFHNPSMARESLAKAITIAQDGIKILDKGIADLKGGAHTAPAPASAAPPAPSVAPPAPAK